MFASFIFLYFFCFKDRVFSLRIVPSALLNSPIAILKATPSLPVPNQEKKEEFKKKNMLDKSRGRFLTRLETKLWHSIIYSIFLFCLQIPPPQTRY